MSFGCVGKLRVPAFALWRGWTQLSCATRGRSLGVKSRDRLPTPAGVYSRVPESSTRDGGCQRRWVHSTCLLGGLEEFFPKEGEDLIEDGERNGVDGKIY